MIESETLLEKCPQCGVWPMSANIQKSASAQREIQFRCPRCQAEEAGRLGQEQGIGRDWFLVHTGHPPETDAPVIALSSRCMHLGCPVRWTAAAERFICPCHGGVYGFDGMVDGGPPVRPLDRFYTEIRGADVYVGPRFSVNSELERFSPRFPGEELDGIGQYLYPSRPTQRKLPGT